MTTDKPVTTEGRELQKRAGHIVRCSVPRSNCMSMLPCSYCGDFADTDDGETLWDVPHVNWTKNYEMICGRCVERFINEDMELDPNLEEAAYDRHQEKLMEETA